MSFTFFSRHIMGNVVKEAVKVMDEAEDDLIRQDLTPGDMTQDKVPWVKRQLGLQSNKFPLFPEYDAKGRKLDVHRCTMNKGQSVDLYVYMTKSEEDPQLWLEEGEEDAPRLLWKESGMVLGRYTESDTRSQEVEVSVSEVPGLLNNGSLWTHAFMTKKGQSPNPKDPSYKNFGISHVKSQMNRLMKTTKKDVHFLVKPKEARAEGDREVKAVELEEVKGEGDTAEGDVFENYWKPTITINPVDFFSAFQRNHIPPNFEGHITFHMPTGNYNPVVYVNEFWTQKKHLMPINDTLETLPVKLQWEPLSFFKWQARLITYLVQKQWAKQQSMGLAADGEEDSFRELLSETSPIILVLTMVISLLHTLFSALAFKNDINFWRNKKRSLEGISVRSMLVNLFFQIVIMLYLADNNTTWVVLGTNAVGLAIEVWKVGRFMVGNLDWGGKDGHPKRVFPTIVLKAKESYRKSKTKEYDDIATTHLMYIVGPLMVGYAIYSLLHQQHKGWYSWVINSLVGFVYMFGFVMMTPQLFINYKLKSVAHMPWRAMTYKFLNTFIDDIFAFIIPMPMMHRLSCFRDDIVFFIFLYQRYLYPVDITRINEFGQSAFQQEDALKASLGTREERKAVRWRPSSSVAPTGVLCRCCVSLCLHSRTYSMYGICYMQYFCVGGWHAHD
ncbi:unnamed protein product, partial [Discosporangium mesarthrocarpum]